MLRPVGTLALASVLALGCNSIVAIPLHSVHAAYAEESSQDILTSSDPLDASYTYMNSRIPSSNNLSFVDSSGLLGYGGQWVSTNNKAKFRADLGTFARPSYGTQSNRTSTDGNCAVNEFIYGPVTDRAAIGDCLMYRVTITAAATNFGLNGNATAFALPNLTRNAQGWRFAGIGAVWGKGAQILLNVPAGTTTTNTPAYKRLVDSLTNGNAVGLTATNFGVSAGTPLTQLTVYYYKRVTEDNIRNLSLPRMSLSFAAMAGNGSELSPAQVDVLNTFDSSYDSVYGEHLRLMPTLLSFSGFTGLSSRNRVAIIRNNKNTGVPTLDDSWNPSATTSYTKIASLRGDGSFYRIGEHGTQNNGDVEKPAPYLAMVQFQLSDKTWVNSPAYGIGTVLTSGVGAGTGPDDMSEANATAVKINTALDILAQLHEAKPELSTPSYLEEQKQIIDDPSSFGSILNHYDELLFKDWDSVAQDLGLEDNTSLTAAGSALETVAAGPELSAIMATAAQAYTGYSSASLLDGLQDGSVMVARLLAAQKIESESALSERQKAGFISELQKAMSTDAVKTILEALEGYIDDGNPSLDEEKSVYEDKIRALSDLTSTEEWLDKIRSAASTDEIHSIYTEAQATDLAGYKTRIGARTVMKGYEKELVAADTRDKVTALYTEAIHKAEFAQLDPTGLLSAAQKNYFIGLEDKGTDISAAAMALVTAIKIAHAATEVNFPEQVINAVPAYGQAWKNAKEELNSLAATSTDATALNTKSDELHNRNAGLAAMQNYLQRPTLLAAIAAVDPTRSDYDTALSAAIAAAQKQEELDATSLSDTQKEALLKAGASSETIQALNKAQTEATELLALNRDLQPEFSSSITAATTALSGLVNNSISVDELNAAMETLRKLDSGNEAVAEIQKLSELSSEQKKGFIEKIQSIPVSAGDYQAQVNGYLTTALKVNDTLAVSIDQSSKKEEALQALEGLNLSTAQKEEFSTEINATSYSSNYGDELNTIVAQAQAVALAREAAASLPTSTTVPDGVEENSLLGRKYSAAVQTYLDAKDDATNAATITSAATVLRNLVYAVGPAGAGYVAGLGINNSATYMDNLASIPTGQSFDQYKSQVEAIAAAAEAQVAKDSVIAQAYGLRSLYVARLTALNPANVTSYINRVTAAALPSSTEELQNYTAELDAIMQEATDSVAAARAELITAAAQRSISGMTSMTEEQKKHYRDALAALDTSDSDYQAKVVELLKQAQGLNLALAGVRVNQDSELGRALATAKDAESVAEAIKQYSSAGADSNTTQSSPSTTEKPQNSTSSRSSWWWLLALLLPIIPGLIYVTHLH